MTPTNLKKLEAIARENFPALEGRPDLETRYNDSEDFFEASVWGVKEALRAAFEYGMEIGQKRGGAAASPRNYHGEI